LRLGARAQARRPGQVLRDASGFIDRATINGATRAARCSRAEAAKAMARARRPAGLSVAAGFGICEPAQARADHGVDAALDAARGFAEASRGKAGEAASA
jgi:tryptophan synthase alpha subunit